MNGRLGCTTLHQHQRCTMDPASGRCRSRRHTYWWSASATPPPTPWTADLRWRSHLSMTPCHRQPTPAPPPTVLSVQTEISRLACQQRHLSKA